MEENDSPDILGVETEPFPIQNNWVRLPKGAGEMIIRIKALNAERVRFSLVPTGTAAWKYRKLLSEDTDGSDGWSAVFRYGDKDILDHIVYEVIGPGGVSKGRLMYIKKIR